jgi:hypothetical protein
MKMAFKVREGERRGGASSGFSLTPKALVMTERKNRR